MRLKMSTGALARHGIAIAFAVSSTFALRASPTPPTSNGLFPFAIPLADGAHGTATDMSFLNKGPAGSHGAIVMRSGHFVESATGKPIRFLGVNIVGASLFPQHDVARSAAAHLSKMGINLVRCHLEDLDDSPLWNKATPGHQAFDPAALDRLDYFLYQLKQNGIYVELGLHSGREFTTDDGFPASVEHLPDHYDKRIDEVDERMIALQQYFARDYLTHVNPYTALSYAKDPFVALVEINNENSLLFWYPGGTNGYIRQLPEPFRSGMVARWNAWLLRKYGDMIHLRQSWAPQSQVAPRSILPTTVAWSLDATLKDAKITVTPASTPEKAPNVETTTLVTGANTWHIQAHLHNFPLKDNATYTLSFNAKADHERALPIYIARSASGQHCGLETNLKLTPEWQTFILPFVTFDPDPTSNRLSLCLAGDRGTVDVSDVKLHSGGDVIPASQSLNGASVEIPAVLSRPQRSDWVSFLGDQELDYANRMRAWLRNDLNVVANIIDTQIDYGGMEGMRREQDSDFADNHGYGGRHPRSPGDRPLTGADWTIPNTPLVTEFAAGNEGVLRSLAEGRVAGKPYTVSEYNVPAPSDYQAEIVPLLSSFASIQDWDGVIWFAYDLADEPMGGWFDMRGNPTKEAFFPSAAALFRMGEISPAPGTATLTVTKQSLLTSESTADVWRSVTASRIPDVLSTRFSRTLDNAAQNVSLAIADGPATVPGNARILNTSSGAQYIAYGRAALVAFGYLGGRTVAEGDVRAAFPAFGNNFAAMTLVANDGKPIGQSNRMLLTIVYPSGEPHLQTFRRA